MDDAYTDEDSAWPEALPEALGGRPRVRAAEVGDDDNHDAGLDDGDILDDDDATGGTAGVTRPVRGRPPAALKARTRRGEGYTAHGPYGRCEGGCNEECDHSCDGIFGKDTYGFLCDDGCDDICNRDCHCTSRPSCARRAVLQLSSASTPVAVSCVLAGRCARSALCTRATALRPTVTPPHRQPSACHGLRRPVRARLMACVQPAAHAFQHAHACACAPLSSPCTQARTVMASRATRPRKTPSTAPFARGTGTRVARPCVCGRAQARAWRRHPADLLPRVAVPVCVNMCGH